MAAGAVAALTLAGCGGHGGAFLGVLLGDVAPSKLPVTAHFRDGRARTFRVEAGPVEPG